MTKYTNQYGTTLNENFPPTNLSEVRELFGSLLLIGLQKQASLKIVFDPEFGIPLIREYFTRARLYQLRVALYSGNKMESPEETDLFWKMKLFERD